MIGALHRWPDAITDDGAVEIHYTHNKEGKVIAASCQRMRLVTRQRPIIKRKPAAKQSKLAALQAHFA